MEIIYLIGCIKHAVNELNIHVIVAMLTTSTYDIGQ